MASRAHRLTSFAMALALSGSPTVLSACLALCLHDAPLSAMTVAHGASAGDAESALASAVAPAHAHHSALAAPAAHAATDAHGPIPGSSMARVDATCGNCCADGVAIAGGPRAERTDLQVFAAGPLVVPVAHFLMTPSVPAKVSAGPPVSPPSPLRAPFVLRI